MAKCQFEHCDKPAAGEDLRHGLGLCARCRDLVERFGHPRTLGDLSSLVALAVLKFGPSKVRAALSRLEDAH
jgi:hypothetical protein